MKCPIPSDANASPSFQEVSPATVPSHSLTHTFLPTRARSPSVNSALAAGAKIPSPINTQKMNLMPHNKDAPGNPKCEISALPEFLI
jgi:hypothetical protein